MYSHQWINIKAATAVTLMASSVWAQNVTIESDGIRPVHVAARALEQTYGWRITYEDPPYAMRESKHVKPGISFLIPTGRPVMFSLPGPIGKDIIADREHVVAEIIRQHSGSGNPGAFMAIHNGDFTHIIPVSHIDESGRAAPYSSLLSTPVTFPAREMTVGEIVDTVLQQVSNTREVTVLQGAGPMNMYAHERQLRGASEETAEDVLVRTFEFVNNRGQSLGAAPCRITWDLLYDPNGKQFFFNAHVIPNITRSKVGKTVSAPVQ